MTATSAFWRKASFGLLVAAELAACVAVTAVVTSVPASAQFFFDERYPFLDPRSRRRGGALRSRIRPTSVRRISRARRPRCRASPTRRRSRPRSWCSAIRWPTGWPMVSTMRWPRRPRSASSASTRRFSGLIRYEAQAGNAGMVAGRARTDRSGKTAGRHHDDRRAGPSGDAREDRAQARSQAGRCKARRSEGRRTKARRGEARRKTGRAKGRRAETGCEQIRAEAARKADKTRPTTNSSRISPRPSRSAARAPRPAALHEYHTEKWEELYNKRIDETIAALKSANVPVLWVGLPSIRGQKSTADAQYLNEFYRAQFREGRHSLCRCLGRLRGRAGALLDARSGLRRPDAHPAHRRRRSLHEIRRAQARALCRARIAPRAERDAGRADDAGARAAAGGADAVAAREAVGAGAASARRSGLHAHHQCRRSR